MDDRYRNEGIMYSRVNINGVVYIAGLMKLIQYVVEVTQVMLQRKLLDIELFDSYIWHFILLIFHVADSSNTLDVC